MPQLSAPLAKQADNANDDNKGREFAVYPVGVYTGRLAKVEATQSSTKKPMWNIEFDLVTDLEGAKMPGRVWSSITLEESTSWKIGQFFDAFGVPTSTNTDMLINHRIRLEISPEVQKFGKNQGKERNTIDRYAKLAEDDDGYEANSKLQRKLAAKSATPAPIVSENAQATNAGGGLDEFAPTPESAPDDLDF